MPNSKFGTQPGRLILHRERWTIPMVARKIEVPEGHLKSTLNGVTRPMPEVRERLPILLGCDLEDLFTDEALAKPYGAHNNPWKLVSV